MRDIPVLAVRFLPFITHGQLAITSSGKDDARGIDAVTLVRCGFNSDIAQPFMVCILRFVTRAANYFLSNLNLYHPAVGLFITDNFNAVCFHAHKDDRLPAQWTRA